METTKEKWYFKTYILAVIFLCVGPLVLPLVWMNPNYSVKKKTYLSLAVLFLSYIIWIAMAASVNSLLSYYNQLSSLTN